MDSSYASNGSAAEAADADEPDPDTDGRVELTHDPAHHIGTTVARGVAAVTDTPADELDAVLNDYVDPDALDRLFAERLDGTDRVEGRVVFPMLGCRVEVYADYRVVVGEE
jgi:hypothetical protein